ncbi:MAG TPA: methyltransferase domain-containing protein [Candidatus Kryptonia bacterium]|nr:methyltransferase domain-containing protein [Candidatus Kryptonia bacterium]
MSPVDALPPDWFRRLDESCDAEFYREPRFVAHIDDATIAALTQVYRELIAPGTAVLDLMSSWISHLPPEIAYGRVAGLGMNRSELARNPRLSDFVVHDLNAGPELPFPDATFDAVVNAVSVQYLTRPVDVYAAVHRVLKPGGRAIVALSHRCFPTKSIAAWHVLPADDRLRLVASYFELAGGYDPPEFFDRSPAGADPLWIVSARRSSARS